MIIVIVVDIITYLKITILTTLVKRIVKIDSSHKIWLISYSSYGMIHHYDSCSLFYCSCLQPFVKFMVGMNEASGVFSGQPWGHIRSPNMYLCNIFKMVLLVSPNCVALFTVWFTGHATRNVSYLNSFKLFTISK